MMMMMMMMMMMVVQQNYINIFLKFSSPKAGLFPKILATCILFVTFEGYQTHPISRGKISTIISILFLQMKAPTQIVLLQVSPH